MIVRLKLLNRFSCFLSPRLSEAVVAWKCLTSLPRLARAGDLCREWFPETMLLEAKAVDPALFLKERC